MQSTQTLNGQTTSAPAQSPCIPLTPEEQRVLALYSNATPLDWEDWRWHIRNRIRTEDALSQVLTLTESERSGVSRSGEKLTMSIPPYFAALMNPDDPQCPIRLQSVPRVDELDEYPEEHRDPCGEDRHSPVHGLVHRYPDRVLFLVNEMCAMYCRYCTRSRMVGDAQRTLSTSTYKAALAYIRQHREIRDVLISGGDPLTLADGVLEDLLRAVRDISHVEFVRIGSRVPVTLPQRITLGLVRMLRRHGPVWMSLHFNHPDEITPRVKYACDLLADHGVPLGSQTVLLKGINDNPVVMKRLMHELLKIRVRPYYIYLCDPILGSRHFRTPVEKGIEIIEQLRGHTTGYAVPSLVIDAPGGGGKIPIGPNYIVGREGRKYILRNYEGALYQYYDPA